MGYLPYAPSLVWDLIEPTRLVPVPTTVIPLTFLLDGFGYSFRLVHLRFSDHRTRLLSFLQIWILVRTGYLRTFTVWLSTRIKLLSHTKTTFDLLWVFYPWLRRLVEGSDWESLLEWDVKDSLCLEGLYNQRNP